MGWGGFEPPITQPPAAYLTILDHHPGVFFMKLNRVYKVKYLR